MWNAGYLLEVKVGHWRPLKTLGFVAEEPLGGHECQSVAQVSCRLGNQRRKVGGLVAVIQRVVSMLAVVCCM